MLQILLLIIAFMLGYEIRDRIQQKRDNDSERLILERMKKVLEKYENN